MTTRDFEPLLASTSRHRPLSLGLALAWVLAACTHAPGAADGGADGGPSAIHDVWTDPSTGLTWVVPGELDPTTGLTWSEAVAHCDELVLAGHDDWFLATIDDLRTLIRGCPSTATGGICGETNDCPGAGTDCYDGDACFGCMSGGPGSAGACFWPTEMGPSCNFFWSSTESHDPPDYPCYADFRNAHLSHDVAAADVGHYALCVRRGA